MTSNARIEEKIAGVRAEVVSVLSPEDRAFLRMLECAGITLDSIYDKIAKKGDLK
jgi:hypothetical protein